MFFETMLMSHKKILFFTLILQTMNLKLHIGTNLKKKGEGLSILYFLNVK